MRKVGTNGSSRDTVFNIQVCGNVQGNVARKGRNDDGTGNFGRHGVSLLNFLLSMSLFPSHFEYSIYSTRVYLLSKVGSENSIKRHSELVFRRVQWGSTLVSLKLSPGIASRSVGCLSRST